MLASPLAFGGDYHEIREHEWIAEDKFDGIRAQVHVRGTDVTIYSRNFNDVTASYPEIASALRSQKHHMILDGEIIAAREGKALPFRTLQARLQRKEIDAALMAEVPLHFMAFDLLALDGTFLIDEPLSQRRAQLAASFEPSERASLAEHHPIAAGSVNIAFEAARARGNEGLMLKRSDSPYAPGRRGKWWYKLKKELSTLDVVVVAVEWGHGKRAKVLSDYTFAVRDESGALKPIGKAYSGLTDAEIARYTTWFLEHQIVLRQAQDDRVIRVEPSIVLEVAFDVIQKSTLHESGYSLRFPRIVRIRDDKPASEIDTIADVDRIYGEMLKRENT
jgi:DNA ligase-1